MPCGFCLNGNVQHRLLWMVSVSVYIFWGPKEKILMCIFFGPKGNILMYIFLGAERQYFSVYIFWGPKGNILMYIFLGGRKEDFSVYIFWGGKERFHSAEESFSWFPYSPGKKKILKWQGSLQFQPMKKGTSPFDTLWMKARKFCNNFSISFATYRRLAP